jgi:hypothetical protein
MQQEGAMGERFDATRVRLQPRQVLPIRDGQGMSVQCLGGAVWITQADDLKDIVLERGQSFVLDRPGLALVTAPSSPSLLAIHPAAHAAPSAHSGHSTARRLLPAA